MPSWPLDVSQSASCSGRHAKHAMRAGMCKPLPHAEHAWWRGVAPKPLRQAKHAWRRCKFTHQPHAEHARMGMAFKPQPHAGLPSSRKHNVLQPLELNPPSRRRIWPEKPRLLYVGVKAAGDMPYSALPRNLTAAYRMLPSQMTPPNIADSPAGQNSL